MAEDLDTKLWENAERSELEGLDDEFRLDVLERIQERRLRAALWRHAGLALLLLVTLAGLAFTVLR